MLTVFRKPLNSRNRRLLTIVHLLPVEILITIFVLVGPPTLRKPYPYLPLSWVCRHWRSIVLNNPTFWTVLQYRTPDGSNTPLIEEFIRRSGSYQLSVFWCQCAPKKPRKSAFLRIFKNSIDRRYHSPQDVLLTGWRVDTLHIESADFFEAVDFRYESFPLLQYLTLTMSYLSMSQTDHLNNILLTSRLRYLHISGKLLRRNMSEGLSRIECLMLDYTELSIEEVSVVCHVLEDLPNLRTLILFSTHHCLEDEISEPTIVLPKLQALIWDYNPGQFCRIIAPNLSYISFSHPFPRESSCLDLLIYIEQLRITNFRIGPCQVGSNAPSAVCISGTNHSLGTVCQDSLDRNSLFNRDFLHISLPSSAVVFVFLYWLHLGKNAIELTWDFGATTSQSLELSCFTEFLCFLDRVSGTITRLNIVRAPRNTVEVLDLLIPSEGPNRSIWVKAPHLERLTYHSSRLVKKADFLPSVVREIQEARIRASFQPLKVLELKNFVTISPESIRKIEGLGVQLIQTS